MIILKLPCYVNTCIFIINASKILFEKYFDIAQTYKQVARIVQIIAIIFQSYSPNTGMYSFSLYSYNTYKYGSI